MSNPTFTHEDDVFIAKYFEAVGAEQIALVDLPFTEKEIEARFRFLKEHHPQVFDEGRREEAALGAFIEHDLTHSMVAALVDISSGKTTLGRGKGRAVSALRDRGLVGSNRMKYELTQVGSYVAGLFRGEGSC